MDKAVKKRVSEAVKRKLKELQVVVADDLPEYIMVMIANRKTKTEIEGELEVFMGEDSGKFATWLVNLVEDSKCFLEDESKFSKSKTKPTVKKELEDAEAVLSLNPQYHEAIELILKDDLELSLPFDKVPEKIVEEVPKKVPEDVPVEDTKLEAAVPKESAEPKNVEPKLDVEKRREHQTSNKHVTDKVAVKRAEKRRKFSGSSSSIHENGVEYDPLYPSFNPLQSPGQSSEKKPSIPLTFQANKLLLFKAVHDANASICGKDKISHVYKPTPIKVLANNKKQVGNTNKKGFSHKDDEWQAMEIGDDNELVWCEKPPVKLHHNLSYPPIQPDSVVSKQHGEHQREVLIKDPTEVPEDFFFVNDEDIGEIPYIPEPYPSPTTSPQFVVTLDGVPKTLKRTYSDTLSEKSLPENPDSQEVSTINESSNSPESIEEKQEEEIPLKRQKVLERCRFWPACKNNEDCEYHHPSVSCKMFPNCKFGDKCLYIHPNCKFNSRCTRKDCSYTHVGKRDFLQVGPSFHIQPRKPKPVPMLPLLCKFYPNCSVYNCPFLHPNKKCRFGADCNTSNCPFFHQNFPSRKQLKWTPGSS